MVEVFDERRCKLGEGPIWHRGRGSLLWFDIHSQRLLERQGDRQRSWAFEGPVSAAGILPDGRILIASHVALQTFDLDTGVTEVVCPLEADNAVTRSNDGRSDPWGGFWIGTMGRRAERGAGAIYRWKGGLKRLFTGITISNSICFSPDRARAYFTDTAARVIWSVPLDERGWPDGSREVFVDLGDQPGNPDGAVCDTDGFLWSARWGAGRVVRHAPDGRIDTEIHLPVSQVTCPAFGGPGFRHLYATTAAEGVSETEGGMTFLIADDVPGHPEPEVLL
ncbi:MAG: SMP-30/gluconolactonase/LRE family protein [Rubricella sp.]